MRKKSAGFLTVGLVVLLQGVRAGWAASATLPPMDSAFDIARSDAQDVVYFRSEDVLRGQLLNEKVNLVTQYGTLSLPLRRCAGLSFEASQANRDAVATVNFNRFTGIITDRVFRFRISSSGSEVPLRKETVAFILLRKTPGEMDFLQGRDKSDLFLMANGDVLSGKAVEQAVQIRTDYANVPISFRDVKEIRLWGGSEVAALVTKTNGETMRGAWETDEVSLALDVGVPLPAIYKDKFARIFMGRALELAPSQFGIEPPAPAEPEPVLPARAVALDEKTIALDLGKSVTLKLTLIAPGKFVMGSPADEGGRDEDEGPQREVIISKPFYLGMHEVTQAQYEAIMDAKPSKFTDAAKPVESVSWEDAAEFCRRLSRRTNQTVALPTEAQWEHACRAGAKTRFSSGDDERSLSTVARYSQGANGGTAPVGSKKPNAWGLYDMHGNVWEWCADWYAGSYVNAATQDPAGPALGESRVLRGGSWINTADGCRCATRNKGLPEVRYNGIGFRIVVNPK